MSYDYLEELEQRVVRGEELFTTPGLGENEWHIGSDFEKLSQKAQMTANSRGYDSCMYKLTSGMDMSGKMVYFVVRKLLEPLASGDPNIRWCIVDTKEAAEMLRDVSQGPSPYFGVMLVKKFKAEAGSSLY